LPKLLQVGEEDQRFIPVTHHQTKDIVNLTHKISLRIARYLERSGFIKSDTENSYLAADALNDDNMNEHQSYSISYRISIGPQKGRKVFSLQTLPPLVDDTQDQALGKVAGFTLHAGVSVKAWQRDKLERLCRYISRPPVSASRLSLTESGNIRYELKTPYRNGTTHVIFEPLDFISKLAALIPSPRVNLTRFHGVFAPNSQYRSGIINRRVEDKFSEKTVQTAIEKQGAIRWAARLKRAFNIDIKKCDVCSGAVKVIACIDDPIAIQKILDHLQARQSHQVILPVSRAPPAGSAFLH
jgi:hypothetical protein